MTDKSKFLDFLDRLPTEDEACPQTTAADWGDAHWIVPVATADWPEIKRVIGDRVQIADDWPEQQGILRISMTSETWREFRHLFEDAPSSPQNAVRRRHGGGEGKTLPAAE